MLTGVWRGEDCRGLDVGLGRKTVLLSLLKMPETFYSFLKVYLFLI